MNIKYAFIVTLLFVAPQVAGMQLPSKKKCHQKILKTEVNQNQKKVKTNIKNNYSHLEHNVAFALASMNKLPEQSSASQSLSARYKCHVCNKQLATSTSLKNHMETHSDIVHTCNICAKPYKTNRQLKNHLKLHSGMSNYKCEKCEKQFLQKSNLQDHMCPAAIITQDDEILTANNSVAKNASNNPGLTITTELSKNDKLALATIDQLLETVANQSRKRINSSDRIAAEG